MPGSPGRIADQKVRRTIDIGSAKKFRRQASHEREVELLEQFKAYDQVRRFNELHEADLEEEEKPVMNFQEHEAESSPYQDFSMK